MKIISTKLSFGTLSGTISLMVTSFEREWYCLYFRNTFSTKCNSYITIGGELLLRGHIAVIVRWFSWQCGVLEDVVCICIISLRCQFIWSDSKIYMASTSLVVLVWIIIVQMSSGAILFMFSKAQSIT